MAQRLARHVLWSVMIMSFLFVVAWLLGFLGLGRSVPYAIFYALFSYVFWAIGAPAALLMNAVLFLFDIVYVPPPVAVVAVTSNSIIKDIWLSGLHCLVGGILNALIYDAFVRLRVKTRLWMMCGGFVGGICGVLIMLPAGVLRTPSVSAVLRIVAWFPNAAFRLWYGYAPTANNRAEIAFSESTKLIGLYVLLVTLLFVLLAVIMQRLIESVADRKVQAMKVR